MIFTAIFLFAYEALLGNQGSLPPISPVFETESVVHDADDPAIWVNKKDPSKSLIFGNDKFEKTGAIYAFDLAGHTVQVVPNLDRPNNLDVIDGVDFGKETISILAVTERKQNRLRIYKIDPQNGFLQDISGKTDVLSDSEGQGREPMGIALDCRKGKVIVVVSPKAGVSGSYLAEYELIYNVGKFDLKQTRRFGGFSGGGQIEALAIDRQSGELLAADEEFGLRTFQNSPTGYVEGDVFAREGYIAQREGLAFFRSDKGAFILSTDQIPDKSRLHVYDLLTKKRITIIETLSDSTDGIEAASGNFGERFPKGFVVMMNSKGKNYRIYDWRDIERRLQTSMSKSQARK